MKKRLLPLLLALLLFTSAARAEAHIKNESLSNAESDSRSLFIREYNDYCRVGDKVYAYCNGYIAEISETGNAEIVMKLPLAEPISALLFSDGESLLLCSNARLYQIQLGAEPQLRPIQESPLFGDSHIFIRAALASKDTIYLIASGKANGTLVYQYNRAKKRVLGQRYLLSANEMYFGLYRDGALYAICSRSWDGLDGYSVYSLKDEEHKLLFHFDESPFITDLKGFVYDAKRNEFYALSGSFLYRIHAGNKEKAALWQSDELRGMLLFPDGLRIYDPRGVHRVAYDAKLDPSRIITMAGYCPPYVLHGFNAQNKDYCAVSVQVMDWAQLRWKNLADLAVLPYLDQQMKSGRRAFETPADLSAYPQFQDVAARCYAFIKTHLYEENKLRYLPFNLSAYSAELFPKNFAANKNTMRAFVLEKEDLPKTYAELADLIFRLFQDEDTAFAPFPPYLAAEIGQQLSLNFANQYALDCKAKGIQPDMDFVRAQLQKIKQLHLFCQKLAEQNTYYPELFVRMYDIFNTDENYVPLPLAPVKDSPYAAYVEMEIVALNENAPQKEGALCFLKYLMAHLPKKNQAKIFSDIQAPVFLYDPEEMNQLLAQRASLQKEQQKLLRKEYGLSADYNWLLLEHLKARLSEIESQIAYEEKKVISEKALSEYRSYTDKLYMPVLTPGEDSEPDMLRLLQEYFEEEAQKSNESKEE